MDRPDLPGTEQVLVPRTMFPGVVMLVAAPVAFVIAQLFWSIHPVAPETPVRTIVELAMLLRS